MALSRLGCALRFPPAVDLFPSSLAVFVQEFLKLVGFEIVECWCRFARLARDGAVRRRIGTLAHNDLASEDANKKAAPKDSHNQLRDSDPSKS